MKCCIILHFILDFTVCKSTSYGASCIQRVNIECGYYNNMNNFLKAGFRFRCCEWQTLPKCYGKSPKFEHFSLSVLKYNFGYQGCESRILVRIANRDDPDQTAFSEVV